MGKHCTMIFFGEAIPGCSGAGRAVDTKEHAFTVVKIFSKIAGLLPGIASLNRGTWWAMREVM